VEQTERKLPRGKEMSGQKKQKIYDVAYNCYQCGADGIAMDIPADYLNIDEDGAYVKDTSVVHCWKCGEEVSFDAAAEERRMRVVL
jgi:transcription elongation factor Elf1